MLACAGDQMRLQKTDEADVYSTFMCCTGPQNGLHLHKQHQTRFSISRPLDGHKGDQHNVIDNLCLKVTRFMKL